MHSTMHEGPVRALIALALVLYPPVLDAQDNLDSLRRVLSAAHADTNRVKTLNMLAAQYAHTFPDSAIAYATQALELAARLGFKAGRADALRVIGYGHWEKEEYGLAIPHFERSLALWTELGDLEYRPDIHYALAWIAEKQSDFPKALENYLESLRFMEVKGDSAEIANMLMNVANVYDQMGDHNEAVRRQHLALGMYEELGDSLGIAQASNNMGTILDGAGQYAEGLKYLTRSLDIARALKDPFGEAINLGAISDHYKRLGQLDTALTYNKNVIGLFEQMDDTYNSASACINTGQMLSTLGRYTEAKEYLNKGIALAASIGAKQWLANAHAALYDVAKKEGDAVAALAHHELQIAYRDSITNEANTRKAVQAQMEYDFEKKEAAAKADQEKKDQRQRIILNSIAGVLAIAVLFLSVLWRQRDRIRREKKRSDELLLNILPEEVAEELKDTGAAQPRHFDTATILFSDFKGFTQLSEKVTPAELVAELNLCFKEFDLLMGRFRIEKIKTIGDAYMAAGGLPDPQHGPAVDVVRAALEMQAFMRQHKAEREAQGKPFFEMRLGIHSGPVVAGIVGVKKFQYDIWGDTVNTASRMESSGEVGQVNISEATFELVKSEPGLRFTPRGKVQAKGKGEMEMYFVGRS